MTNDEPTAPPQATLFGHPTGLFVLFFAEMWERFSYYGMRALLALYMLKGFLGYEDREAYAVYGAYTALVYLTPFFGGLLADRVLGQRWAVILGGVLMSAGHLTMTIEQEDVFFLALALLVVGNGFFKPNISTMVGQLYGPKEHRRDAGFTIFYMGINLGAAIAPLLCGYVGEAYGWHYGFGLATIGMLIGLSIFWAPTRLSQGLILSGAVFSGAAMIYLQVGGRLFLLAIYAFMGAVLVAAGIVAFRALGRGGLPDSVGRPPSAEALHRRVWGMPAWMAVLAGTALSIPLFYFLIASRTTRLLDERYLGSLEAWGPAGAVASIVLTEMSTPAGLLLTVCGAGALAYLVYEAVRMAKVPRERMFVVLILTSFSMLFWAFFEQAGSSISLFTDRNVDRVFEDRTVAEEDVGRREALHVSLTAAEVTSLTQEQLGYADAEGTAQRMAAEALVRLESAPSTDATGSDGLAAQAREADALTMTGLNALRADLADHPGRAAERVPWTYTPQNVGMGVGGTEIPASTFQAVNPIYILLFGLPIAALWTWLGKRDLEPSTPTKFSLGILQLGLGFGALWLGCELADERGMVGLVWLLLGYLLHTTGELCLSPVGLSMVTRLTPKRLVSTAMGAWFLATAFSNFLAAVIAQFTGVEHGDAEGKALIPVPAETVANYGEVFGNIGIAAVLASVLAFAMVPLLKRWTHPEAPLGED